jgi:Ulp1 family protease
VDLVALRYAPLEASELSTIEAVTSGPRNTEVLIDKFNVEMTRHSMTTLRDNCWLDDEVINFYMQLLKQRDEALCATNPQRRPSLFMNTFFMQKLLDTPTGYCYANVKCWTKKFDVFAHDKMIFPINLNNTHWTLLVIYFQRRRIQYYDSMAGQGVKYLRGALRWLNDEFQERKGGVDESDWELVPCIQAQTPQQHNGVDCGAFTTMFADFISDDLELSFGQEHIPLFRRRIGAAILRGALDYPLS